MKGFTKALQRTPHNLTSRIGMSKTSSDPEFNDYERKFAAVEQACEKMLKDSTVFRDSVSNLLSSGSSFSTSLATLFSPMGAEYNLASKHPQAEVTVKNIGVYQGIMEESRETLLPELELIDSRIVQPCKELHEICKKIRKTIVKRGNKLIDYDRHNNALNKLREKKEKSLSDEKNLFKVEQDFEIASGEYEHYNSLLKQELPLFLAMSTRFIDPLFHSFYYMQLNVFYIIQDKLQSFADGKYDLSRKDIETIYFEQRGDTAEQIEEMAIVKRITSTAKMLQTHRSVSGTPTRTGSIASRTTSASYLDRKDSYGSSSPSKKETFSPPTRTVAAPPPYTTSTSSSNLASVGGITKKAPPPPPPLKPKPSFNRAVYATAVFDFEAQAEGDLSFSAGDRIEIIEKTENPDEWWTGRLNGVTGIFPGTYTQVDA